MMSHLLNLYEYFLNLLNEKISWSNNDGHKMYYKQVELVVLMKIYAANIDLCNCS